MHWQYFALQWPLTTLHHWCMEPLRLPNAKPVLQNSSPLMLQQLKAVWKIYRRSWVENCPNPSVPQAFSYRPVKKDSSRPGSTSLKSTYWCTMWPTSWKALLHKAIILKCFLGTYLFLICQKTCKLGSTSCYSTNSTYEICFCQQSCLEDILLYSYYGVKL